MSFILRALKKAEAERDVGHVPTLHAQPGHVLVDDEAQRRRAWPWVFALVVLVLLSVAAAWWLKPQPVVTPVPSLMAAGPTIAASSPVGMPPVPAPAPALIATPSAALPPASRPVVPAPLPARPVPAAPAPNKAEAVASTAVPALAPFIDELDAEQRRSLPAISVAGSIYAERAADRMLIVNGQVLREGDAAGPELTLISIGPKSAVLRFRQQRFSVRY